MAEIKEPYDFFDDYDREVTDKLMKYPCCEICDNPITDEKAIYYNDQYCCKNCEEYFWMNIREDFLVWIKECEDGADEDS